jgi:hypothetical protein
MATLAGFLGYVNYRDPFLGKALDYLLTAGRKPGKPLQITMPEGTTAGRYVIAGRDKLNIYAAAFFGRETEVEILTRQVVNPDLNLFPIDNSKLWNQITFFLKFGKSGCDDLPGAGIGALVISKKEYRTLQKRFTPSLKRDELEALLDELKSDFFRVPDLAAMVDKVVPRAQERRGIVHLVTLCASEREFLELDYTCARIKESGTPGHEGPLQVRSLLGRLHAVFPGQYCTGLAVVHILAQ